MREEFVRDILTVVAVFTLSFSHGEHSLNTREQRALDVAQAFDTGLRTWTLLVAQIHGILDLYRELLHLRYLTQFQVQYLNVLVICSGENLRYAIEQVDCCSPIPVRTLMYGAERSRYWDVVGNVMTSGEVELSAAAFPNTQHGLNMRQLVIGTNEEVDLAMAPLTTSVDRGRVVDFAYPFYYGYAGGVFKSPALKHKAMKTLLEPFQYPVFLCLAIVFVVLSIQLYLGEKYGGSTSQNYSSSPLWADTIMFVFGTFVRCVTECTVVSRSGRVLVISLWIFTIIIAAAYSGNLMAILTLARDNAPFNTIDDVTKQTEYTWGVSGGTIWYSKFETEPDFKNVWEGIKEFNRTDPRVTSFDQTAHCDKVNEGSYVYFTELHMASVCAGNSCGIQAITETFYRISYACAFPKVYVTKNIFDLYIMDSSIADQPVTSAIVRNLAVQYDRLYFRYNIREPTDGEWGRVLNGNWTGMIQMLMRNEIDIAMAPLNPTSERQAVVDFSYPMSTDVITVLLTKNDSQSEKWRTYLQPFSQPVYGFIGLSFVLATIMLTVLERCSPRTLGPRRVSSKSLWDMSWHMLGSLFAQGGVDPPRSRPGNVMMSFWWLFSFIMATVYSGNLIAFLTINVEHPLSDGLEDIVNRGDYTYGYVGGSSYDTFFEVKAGSYAFIGPRLLFGLWMVDNCDLTVMKETLVPSYTSFALPKHSELTKIFSDQVLSFYETGLMDLWRKKWWPSRSKCVLKQRKGQPIRLVDKIHFLEDVRVSLLGALVQVMMPSFKVVVAC
ncbi:glutamate receptor ionotropic, kainate 3-like [Haliotis rufescens]|uniref:glutamate receptor ionotropic, kainate 3-like n=1 Tax=Haliotis rufescens TaxID=6454 RepID=UPI00201EEEC6|nr:glutamate receptor ionotropic, kainate 3-like [Haliotis rufescens]